MTFEEEFPELKEYQSHSGEYGDYDRGDNVVSCGAVAKHCKSNQRIKEAVMMMQTFIKM